MDSMFFPRKKLLPPPKITPSHGKILKYPEMTQSDATLVIDSYPGIAVGQKVQFAVRGYGVVLGGFEIETLQPKYEVNIRFNIFDIDIIEADYYVIDGKKVVEHSHKVYYDVIDRPESL